MNKQDVIAREKT